MSENLVYVDYYSPHVQQKVDDFLSDLLKQIHILVEMQQKRIYHFILPETKSEQRDIYFSDG